MGYKTTKEAAYAWVNEFNAIPTDMIERLIADHPEYWREVTSPSVGDRVYATSYDENGVATWNGDGEIVDTKEDDEDESILYGIKFDDC